jgi:NAD(P)-dependent dehydrogenase (short-subunit alcohol dehydrogenase family)
MAFNGKVALITGGASGMGRCMALRLAEAGAQVVIVDLDQKMLDETAALSPNIHARHCDVTQARDIAEVVTEVQRGLGPIDRLATAAGIMPARSIAEMPVENFAKVMRVNYEGMANTVKAVLPQMQQRRSGDLILFGSLAGVVFTKHFAAYNASKAAVNAFAEVLAQELAGSGIRVLNVRPSAVKTPLIAQATGDGGLKALRKSADSGRMATPEQIVAAIEVGLEKGLHVLYPGGEAKFAAILRRLSPALTWKLMNKVS